MANMVKSVEFVEYTQDSSTISSQINLTQGQDYTNCVPFMTVHGCSDNMRGHFIDVYFTGTTESGVINFDRSVTDGCPRYIKCYVVEFYPEEIKVQQGSFTATGAVIDAYTTSSGFEQTKSAMVHYWKSTNSTSNWNEHLVRGRVLSNNTQVDFYRHGSGGTVTGHYFLFEDITVGNDHFVVQHQDENFTGTGTNKKVTDGRGDWSKTIIIGSFANSNAAYYPDRGTARIIQYFRNFSRVDRQYAVGTVYSYVQHLTFLDDSKVYIADNFYSGMGSGSTTQSRTLKRTVDLNKSCIISTTPMGICRGTSTSASEIDSLWVSMKLTDENHAYFQRNSDGGGNSAYFAFSVVYWDGVEVDTGSNPSPLDPNMTFVKSVENFRLNIEGYYAAYDLTKGQNIDNCALFCSQRGNATGSNQMRESMATVWAREPGIVYGHSTDGSGQTYVDVSVVEFYPDQVRVQHGEWTHWGTTTETATISGVNTDRAFILAKWESNEATWWSRNAVRIRFVTASGVEFYRNDSGNMITGDFYVVEDLGNNFRTEHNITAGTGTYVNHVFPEFYKYYRDFMIGSFANTNDAYYVDRGAGRLFWSGAGSRPQMNRENGTGTFYCSFTMVKMLRERFYVHYFSPTFDSSTTSITRNVTSVFTGHEDALSIFNSMQMSVGRGTSTGSDDMRGTFHTFRLINSNTQVECTRETTAGITLYPSYGQVIDWIGYIHPLADENGDVPKALPTKDLVRSIEKFTYTGSGRIIHHYLTKGQRPENCIPFHTWRVGSNDNYMERLLRWSYIDSNSRVTTTAESTPYGGDLDEVVYVVEFDPSQVKIQQVYGYSESNSVNVDIEEVDLTKAFLYFGWSIDGYTHQWDDAAVTGSFISSTQLNFSIYGGSTAFYVHAYVVECLQDQWTVKHIDTGSQSSNDFDVYVNFDSPKRNSRLIFGSFSSSNANYYVDRNCMRLYPRQDHGFHWNKNNNTGAVSDSHVEVIEFNENLDIKVGGYWVDLGAGNTHEEKGFLTDYLIDLDRSFIVNTVANSINRGDSTGTDDNGAICIRLEIIDESTWSSDNYDKGINVYGWAQWVEFPPYKSHYFEGTVTELGSPVVRQVACHRADTYELMDYTTSASGTGYYRLETTYSGAHYIICQDDIPGTSYNDLILGKMEPEPITSGTVWGGI